MSLSQATYRASLLVHMTVFLCALCITNTAWTQDATTYHYDVSRLVLNDVRVKVNVNVKQQDGMRVTLVGPDAFKDMIKLNTHNDTLNIQQTGASSMGDVSVITLGNGTGNNQSNITINGTSTLIEGNGVVIAKVQEAAVLSLEITVPPGTQLAMHRFKGNAKIGDLKAPFLFSGSGKVDIGAVTAMHVDINRNGRIKASHVSEQLRINATGNSKVSFATGDVDLLQADLEDNSRVKYIGHADNATLSITDNARLFIASLDQRKKTHVDKNGRLTIGNW